MIDLLLDRQHHAGQNLDQRGIGRRRPPRRGAGGRRGNRGGPFVPGLVPRPQATVQEHGPTGFPPGRSTQDARPQVFVARHEVLDDRGRQRVSPPFWDRRARARSMLRGCTDTWNRCATRAARVCEDPSGSAARQS